MLIERSCSEQGLGGEGKKGGWLCFLEKGGSLLRSWSQAPHEWGLGRGRKLFLDFRRVDGFELKRNPQRVGMSELRNGPELLVVVQALSPSKVEPAANFQKPLEWENSVLATLQDCPTAALLEWSRSF